MRTMSKITWAIVGVSSVGVLVGVGLLLAGDWLGRRDEAALRAVMPAPVPVTSPAIPPAASTEKASIATINDSIDISDVLAKLQRGASDPANAAAAYQAAQAITVVSDEERVVDRQQILEATHGSPIGLLLSQARLVPHLDGSDSGLRIASKAEGPWGEKVGLEVGDIVTAVNGKPVIDPLQMGAIAKTLLSADEVAVTVHRAGQDVNLQYHMGPPAQAPLGSVNP